MPEKNIFPEIIQNLPKADINIDGLDAYIFQGDMQQILFMCFDKDVTIDEHSHEEQWGVVLDGTIELTIGNEKKIFKKGDQYYIPKGVKHSAYIKRGYQDITLFNQKDRYKIKK